MNMLKVPLNSCKVVDDCILSECWFYLSVPVQSPIFLACIPHVFHALICNRVYDSFSFLLKGHLYIFDVKLISTKDLHLIKICHEEKYSLRKYSFVVITVEFQDKRNSKLHESFLNCCVES